MNTRALLTVVAVTLPVAAQGLASPIQPMGALQAISHNSGLQADFEGAGLLGVGARYCVHFRDAEVRYEPALGKAAPVTQFVALSAPAVARGGTTLATSASAAPVARERCASYARGNGIEEHYDVQPDGVELSWVFAERPAGDGDLVVRYAVDTNLGEPSIVDGELHFARDYGGVRVGKVTGVDARGNRVDGSLRWDGGGVMFSLPARFVDRAIYPIVLDPVIGSVFLVAAANPLVGEFDQDPDAAYDATTDRWLVVWRRQFATSGPVPMAQLVSNASGSLVGPLLALDTGGAASSAPRVANHGLRDEFGVVYTRHDFGTGTRSVEFRRVSATTAAALGGATLASAPNPGGSPVLLDADIGARVEPPTGSNSGYTVVYSDNSFAVHFIVARRVLFNAVGGVTVGTASTLWASVAPNQFTSPALSRAAAADGKLLAVAVRQAGSLNAIVAVELDAGSDTPGITGDLVPNTTAVLSHPDVDGYDGKWVLAYENPVGMLVTGPGISVRPITHDEATNTLVVGNIGMSVGSGPTNQAFAPSVAYAPGRTWLGYRAAGAVLGGTVTTIQVRALDSSHCANCNDPFSATVQNAQATAVVATMTSGGVPNGESALCAYLDQTSPNGAIFAQRLRNFGTVGTTVSLGGGCGATGALTFNHAPGIGSSGFRATLSNIPATAVLPIFNFGVPTSTIPCAACVWTPFSITQTPPILAGQAFVEFPIPCLTTLVGQQFETQWTLLDFSQAPCPVFPGFALSNRTLLTIGN